MNIVLLKEIHSDLRRRAELEFKNIQWQPQLIVEDADNTPIEFVIQFIFSLLVKWKNFLHVTFFYKYKK